MTNLCSIFDSNKGWSVYSGLPQRLFNFKNVQFISNLLEILVMIYCPTVYRL